MVRETANGINYYSQCGQDQEVVKIFGGLKYGYFIEAGAADGVCISNTYALETQFEWDGLCVEPHAVNFEKLKANRKCTLDNSFILRDGGEVDFTEFQDIGHRESLFSSIHPPAQYSEKPRTVRKLPTVSLFSLFEKHHVPSMIHYLSLDIDLYGDDYEVLKEYFEAEYAPKAGRRSRYILTLSIEHNFKEPYRKNVRQLLESYNFMFHKQMMHDDFYVHRTIDILL